MKQFIAFCALVLPLCAATQTGPDLRTLLSIRSELALTADQDSAITRLFRATQHTCDSLDRRINVLEATATDESMLSTQVAILHQKKKDARELRDLETQLLLTSAQRLVYDERIKPKKPQVLHFGVHDRMNCNVCNK